MGSGGSESEDRHRIADLLRVNAELAAELRSLSLGRRDSPRLGPVPAARRLARLVGERDEANAESQAVRTELEASKVERDELRRRNGELQHEVTRLRSGVLGLFRRVRARLLRS